MAIIVKLLGIAIVVFSVTFIVKPETVEQYLDFWKKGKRMYAAAVLNVVVGLALLAVASQCTLSLVVTTIGILSLVKGVALAVLGPKKAITQFSALLKLPPKKMRTVTLVSLAIGIIIIYSA